MLIKNGKDVVKMKKGIIQNPGVQITLLADVVPD